jgi:hypothetical protein
MKGLFEFHFAVPSATHFYPLLVPCSSLKMLCEERSELVVPIT